MNFTQCDLNLHWFLVSVGDAEEAHEVVNRHVDAIEVGVHHLVHEAVEVGDGRDRLLLLVGVERFGRHALAD